MASIDTSAASDSTWREKIVETGKKVFSQISSLFSVITLVSVITKIKDAGVAVVDAISIVSIVSRDLGFKQVVVESDVSILEAHLVWLDLQERFDKVEGACKEGGRGASIWDAFSHTEGKIADQNNGDVSVDHYHRYKEDTDLIAKLGFDAFRFSISWPRIFPDGFGTKVNDEGDPFYNNLIDALPQRGIQPYVTLYHWVLPLHLHESMGDAAVFEYQSKYQANYRSELRSAPDLRVLHCEWAEEAYSDKIDDKAAAARRLDFLLGCQILLWRKFLGLH
ncbi:hypothetical protein K1719_039881 [Acacia pycnantha]|nr:hypothetical protein K1719_039881 [Acacia pycnantha]